MIVAITGGRDVRPTAIEIDALVEWLAGHDATILRHGDARGLDRTVAGLLEQRLPDLDVRAWPAAWGALGRSAGPRRNRAMLTGDLRSDSVAWHHPREVHGTIAARLVAWPGGAGTADCIKAARQIGIEVVSIADLVADYLAGQREAAR